MDKYYSPDQVIRVKKKLFGLIFLASFLLILVSSIIGCKKSSSATTAGETIPVVATESAIINVTSTTAMSGGTITSDGNGTLTANGVCYSTTNQIPTTADSKTNDGIGDIGIAPFPFTSNLKGLTPNVVYYLRAYATNSVGTGYGNVLKFTTSTSLTAITTTVTTFAGSGTAGYLDGTGINAQFNSPSGISFDKSGNMYVSDSFNNLVREITPAGVTSTFAGNGTVGFADGTALTAEFYGPNGLTFDAAGNLYVADFGNNAIREVTSAGIVTTYAGNGTAGYYGGSVAANFEFNNPWGVAIDAAGNTYVADHGNNVIRKITAAGFVSTLAGSTARGYLDATGNLALFNGLGGLTIDATGNLYVADGGNHAIRKITPAGVVTTIAGGPVGQADLLNLPVALTIDSKGNLFIVDEGGRILEYTSANVIYTLAGTANVAGFTNGAGTVAQFNSPQGIALDSSGNIYVADQNNNCIRKIVVSLVQQQ